MGWRRSGFVAGETVCTGFALNVEDGGRPYRRGGGERVKQSYIRPERLWLKAHPELSEKWVQKLIADHPSILGLGDLVLRDQERIHPRAGRLDLLLQDPETKRRYEIELQLGATDEAHIIRTIEYWDIERKRYPQYEHCAVLVAEDITSRFLNVISLFNGTIPFVVIQMQALTIGEHISLVFTTVVDELTRGLVDEDEDAEAVPTDRAYWENQATKATVALADELLQIAKQFDPTLELKYNKFYIGLSRDGQPFNFVTFRPKKNQLRLELKLPETDDLNTKIENSGIETLDYDERWGRYRLRLTKNDVKNKAEIIRELMNLAYERRAT
jgi:predicted transport protein